MSTALSNEELYYLFFQAAMDGKTNNVIDLVEKHKIDVNAINSDNGNSTALHSAAFRGHVDIINYLLSKDANTRAIDEDGFFPIHHAACCGENAAFKLLATKDLESLNITLGAEKRTAMHFAILMNRISPETLFSIEGFDVNAKDAEGYTALHRAAEYGHKDMTKSLLLKGADVGLANNHGITPIYQAQMYKQQDIVAMIAQHNPESVNAQYGENKETLLHYCIKRGYDISTIVSIKGVNTNSKDALGNTPLHDAARLCQTNAVKKLLPNGPDLFAVNNAGRSPLDEAQDMTAMGAVMGSETYYLLKETIDSLQSNHADNVQQQTELAAEFNGLNVTKDTEVDLAGKLE